MNVSNKIYSLYKKNLFYFWKFYRHKDIIRVYSIRRSGQHAIIYWILNNYNGNYYFSNNVIQNTHVYYGGDFQEVRFRPYKRRYLLIYNIENPLLNYHYGNKVIKENGTGRFNNDINIIIIRTAKNTFSSYYSANWEWDSFFKDNLDYRNFIKLKWLILAKEVLNETNHLDNKIIILYDKWIVDQGLSKKYFKGFRT